MKSVYASAAIGLTIGIGPAIIAQLIPQIGMIDQLGPVILGLIIGMQAASPRGTQHGRRRAPRGLAGERGGTPRRPRQV
jgi:hypothetical protein